MSQGLLSASSEPSQCGPCCISGRDRACCTPMQGAGSRTYLLSMIRLQADTECLSSQTLLLRAVVIVQRDAALCLRQHALVQPWGLHAQKWVPLTNKSFVPMCTIMPFTLIPSGLSPCWMRHSRFSDVSPAGTTRMGSGHAADAFVAKIAQQFKHSPMSLLLRFTAVQAPPKRYGR